MVDVLDTAKRSTYAGPVLQARVRELRAMRESALSVIDGNPSVAEIGGEDTLVSNTFMRDFRVIVTPANPDHGRIALSDADQQLLACQPGDAVRTLSLNLRKSS